MGVGLVGWQAALPWHALAHATPHLPPDPPHPTSTFAAVVSAVQEVCIQRNIEPPTIITESGRALASHHSVLVFDVLTT